MQTEGKMKYYNKKRVIRIKYRVFVPVKCHVRTVCYKLGSIPTCVACPVVQLLWCRVLLALCSEELKQLRHAVV